MKVGILTFPHAPSLGAMLQMGALYHKYFYSATL